MLSLVTQKKRTENRGLYQVSILLTLIIFCLIFIASPATAGVKYLSGEPNLTASISGSNEFTPGNATTLPVIIENTGLINMKIVQSGIVDRDDLPSTAKMVRVTLLPDGAPVLIKSDPQMAGDITGSSSKKIEFKVRVPDDAKAGTYKLPIRIEYTYLADAEQYGTDSVINRYNKKVIMLEIPYIIKSAINLDVVSVFPEDINAGGEGFVTVKLKNSGSDIGKKAIVKLVRSGTSPVVPVDSTVYIGEFSPGQEVETKFKVSVSRDAEPQEYPLEVLVTYENVDGDILDTPAQSFGVKVGAKIDFTVVSDPANAAPGEKNIVEVTYRNDGGATAYSAEARISAVDPFSSNDDLAFLGDMEPGQTSVARFELSTGSEAVEKMYGLDSEIRYRDALDNSQISNTVKVRAEVVKSEGTSQMLKNPIVLAIILAVIILGMYSVIKIRKNNALNPNGSASVGPGQEK